MKGPVKEADVAAVFDKLKPVKPALMLGSWNGGAFDTGHPGKANLEKSRWAGKDFLGLDDVWPVVIYDDNGERMWSKDQGQAVVCFTREKGVFLRLCSFVLIPCVIASRGALSRCPIDMHDL